MKEADNMSRLIGVLVIPNENITQKSLFYRQKNNGYHPVFLQEACNLYGVNPFDEYNSLLNFGCIVGILVLYNDLTMYLPKELSEKQIDYLHKLRPLFSKFDFMDFQVWDSNNFHVYKKNNMTTEETLDWFYQEIENYYRNGLSI